MAEKRAAEKAAMVAKSPDLKTAAMAAPQKAVRTRQANDGAAIPFDLGGSPVTPAHLQASPDTPYTEPSRGPQGKRLYGLRQAPRAWNSKLDTTLSELGFEKCPLDSGLYRKKAGGSALIVGVYVDDLVITGGSEQAIEDFKRQMKSRFSMTDLGLLSYYLGIEVKQSEKGITLCQTGYASRILEKMGMTNCNASHTPMEPRLTLSRTSQAEEVDPTEYRSIVGSLRYLLHTRPDLCFAVGYISRFMERPTKDHMTAVKHILRYVKGTLSLGCSYWKTERKSQLLGYYDSNHARDIDDQKSTTGVLYYYGNCLVS